jgi:DNA-binding transcriptional regulator GbsR (MarR family)
LRSILSLQKKKSQRKDSGNWGFRDHFYVSEDDLFSVIEHIWYVIGEKYIKETWNALEEKIKRKLQAQNSRKVHRQTVQGFMQRNEAALMQCMLTGYWGWTTHKDFVLNHALNRAWKYLE